MQPSGCMQHPWVGEQHVPPQQAPESSGQQTWVPLDGLHASDGMQVSPSGQQVPSSQHASMSQHVSPQQSVAQQLPSLQHVSPSPQSESSWQPQTSLLQGAMAGSNSAGHPSDPRPRDRVRPRWRLRRNT